MRATFLRRALLPLLTGVALAGVAGAASAADLAAGEKLANERCAACHGKDGNTPIDPSYPRLSGQHEDYLVHSMRAYKQDERKNPIMGAMAQPLTAQDIENMAAYYAAQPGPLKSLY